MLTDTQKAMLNLASEKFKYAGSLDSAAMDRFGMTPTRFWQEVNHLIQTEAAVAYSPAAVDQLRNRRRSMVRTASRLLR
ncbi:DUF3263 domain-containing protein [Paenarthrobacter nicotinovorans]|uniref:DUF3263 domain-containing protein n=1 Tax=Paenarthrobacter nicotinovorans TaxID=29320 RepID=UPI0024861ADB|nr:DUF3263 domain-containing protein [Paenarthrobacter nicotinovorans]MDI2019606.1 hypothetical protein [Paenarthrobacter nicotinovorans]